MEQSVPENTTAVTEETDSQNHQEQGPRKQRHTEKIASQNEREGADGNESQNCQQQRSDKQSHVEENVPEDIPAVTGRNLFPKITKSRVKANRDIQKRVHQTMNKKEQKEMKHKIVNSGAQIYMNK